MSRQIADSLLAGFGETIGIPGLAFDEKGSCSLVFDGNILVNVAVEERRRRLVLFSFLCELPRSSRSKQFAAMLEGNFFWQGTDGATLSFETASRSALLMYPVPLEGLNPSALHMVMERFVNTAETWVARLTELIGRDEDDDPRLEQPKAAFGLRV
jgi:hypothetical protein